MTTLKGKFINFLSKFPRSPEECKWLKIGPIWQKYLDKWNIFFNSIFYSSMMNVFKDHQSATNVVMSIFWVLDHFFSYRKDNHHLLASEVNDDIFQKFLWKFNFRVEFDASCSYCIACWSNFFMKQRNIDMMRQKMSKYVNYALFSDTSIFLKIAMREILRSNDKVWEHFKTILNLIKECMSLVWTIDATNTALERGKKLLLVTGRVMY